MPQDGDRELAQRLVPGKAQIVEVLGKQEYEEWHFRRLCGGERGADRPASEGRLVGLLRREDALRAAHEHHSHSHG